MLSNELLEAQNTILHLNALVYKNSEDDDSVPFDTKEYGEMLVHQFDECLTEFLDATEEYSGTDNFDRESPDHIYDFTNETLKDLKMKSLVSLAELCAVLKAQKKETENGVKNAFSLTADNKQTLSSLEAYTKSQLYMLRTELAEEEDNGDVLHKSPDEKMATIEMGDQTSEYWSDLEWANIMLENPTHPIHAEFANHNGFHIGPAMERAIVLTRKHLEFFSSVYFYLQMQCGENNTQINQEQVDYFTDGTNEISTIVIALRNLACNGQGMEPDGSNIETIARNVGTQYGELRIH